MGNIGVTTEQVLRAVYSYTDISNTDWRTIDTMKDTDLFGLKYSDFERAIRASGLLTTPWVIRSKWDNIVAQGIIINEVMKGKKPTVGVVCLNRMKSAVPIYKEQTFVPRNVHQLDTFSEKTNKTNKQNLQSLNNEVVE